MTTPVRKALNGPLVLDAASATADKNSRVPPAQLGSSFDLPYVNHTKPR